MTQRTFIAAAFVTLIAAFPAAVPGGSPMSADQQPYTNAVDGYTYTYFDPVVISSDCVGSVDPLGCTAEADAGTLADDAAADALSPEGATEDGAVLDSPEPDASSSDSSALDSSSFDPSAADPFTYDSPWFDSQPALDPEAASSPLELSTIDPAPELDAPIQAEALAASVRPIVRGFNTRQEADYLGDGNTRRWDAAWAEIAGTHVRVHRLAVYWWDVQCRGADQWDFGKYIRVAEAARARNMRLILTPVGSPNWARSPGRQTPTKENPDGSHDPCVAVDASGLGIFAHPDNLNAWTQFIHHLALTFRPFNPIGYEIWNEENSRDFWDRVGIPGRTPQPPCPTCWTRYYCLATGQIDANDPGKAVGVGGLAAYHANQFVTVDGRRVMTNMRSSAFLQRAYSARRVLCAGKPFDYVGYHPYVYRPYYDGHSPPGGIGNTATMIELRSVRGVMLNHADRGRRIWNTEWGFPSGTFVDGGSTHTIGEPRQAALIRLEHAYLAALRDPSGFHYMRFSILFNPIDSFPNDVFSHIGVVWVSHVNVDDANNPDLWRRKPSYAAWTSLPQP